jgi:hypothetical protein
MTFYGFSMIRLETPGICPLVARPRGHAGMGGAPEADIDLKVMFDACRKRQAFYRDFRPFHIDTFRFGAYNGNIEVVRLRCRYGKVFGIYKSI